MAELTHERLSSDEEDGAGDGSAPQAGRFRGAPKLVLILTAFVDILGFSIPNPLMPYYFSTLRGFTGDAEGLMFGVIMSSFSMGQLIGSVVAGVLSDRIGRRKPILACLAGNALFLVYTAFAPDVYQLFLARGMAGLFAGTQSVCSAYVSDQTTKAERPTELAHLQTAVTVGFIAGPALGIAIGLAFGLPHIGLAWIVTCLFAAAIAATAFVLGMFVLNATSAALASASAFSIVWSLVKKRDMLLVVLVACVTSFMGTSFEAALPLLLVREQSAAIWQVVVVFGSLAVQVPLITVFVYPLMIARMGNKATMFTGIMAQAVGCALLPVFTVWYLQAAIVSLLALGAVAEPGMQLVASYNAGGAFGAAMGLLRSAGALARVFGPFAAGALYDVEFGAFLDRRRLLPFWVATAWGVLGSVLVLGMRNTEPRPVATLSAHAPAAAVEMDSLAIVAVDGSRTTDGLDVALLGE